MQDNLPSSTWEFYLLTRIQLGLERVCAIFNISHTQYYRYSRNPDVTADGQRNPLDIHRQLFAELAACGQSHVVLAALNMLAEPVGGRVVLEDTEWDCDNLASGSLDMVQAMDMLVARARKGDHPSHVILEMERLAVQTRRFCQKYDREFRASEGAIRFHKVGGKDVCAEDFAKQMQEQAKGKKPWWKFWIQ